MAMGWKEKRLTAQHRALVTAGDSLLPQIPAGNSGKTPAGNS
jgi:hypothetical protein